MIQIDGGERIRFGQHIADAVGMSGLHSGQRGGVVAPGVGILRAGMPLRLVAMNGGFCQLPLSPASSATRPLRPLDQRRQRPRQLCQIALMCSRFVSSLH